MSISEKLVRNAPNSSANLIDLLRNGLGWPFPADMEPAEVPLLPWKPSEIGLDEKSVARLERIVQIPKLAEGQPFGVFILDFEAGSLPIGAVRRLVDRLVRKKRATKASDRPLWDLSDLIFFCQSRDGASTMHVVAFHDTGKTPVLRAISWDSEDNTNRIDITKVALSRLAWPEPGKSDLDEWRKQWQGAFRTGYKEGIKTAKQLAEHMADVAKNVRDEVRELVAIESEGGPLRRLQSELKANLIADLDDRKFADMYAQTMVYGLLTARISHPEDFEAEGLNAVLKFENPFLDSLYSSFRKTGDESFDVDEFGLHDLAATLGSINIEEVLADFGDENPKDDPVVFFYEEFLTRYDPDQRRELGAYYTPIPVVRFMVRAVDHIIKEEFGLPLGVADPTTWAEYSKSRGIPIPEGLSGSDPVIRMIDPATGTGTFLLEWLRQAWANLGPNATDEVKRSVVERMDAFEISLSSYAVAHLKTNLELPVSMRHDTRFDILLTDSLAGSRPEQDSLFGEDPIAEEGKRAEYVKFESHHSVVLGNPPYLYGQSGGAGGWITNPSDGSKPLFDDVRIPATENTIFSHIAHIYNHYVYFWRWAIWKALEQTSDGPGIVCFITASSWLDGPGYMGLRQLARKHSTSIHVVDLGGDGRGAVKDEGVFPIQTPVSIVLLVRGPTASMNAATNYRYIRVTGTREQKLEWLKDAHLDAAVFETFEASGLERMKPTSGGDDWAAHPALADLFPWQQPGCKFGRTWPIAPDPDLLRKRWRKLVGIVDLEERADAFITPTSGRNIFTKVGDLSTIASLGPKAVPTPIVRYNYRSFDRQWSFDDPRLAALERPALWASVSDKQVFLGSKMTRVIGVGPAIVASVGIPDLDIFYGSEGGKDIIPVFRDADGEPNLDPAMADLLAARLEFDLSGVHERLVSYVFGVLAGADYTSRFADELQTPGPRVPLTADRTLFDAMADHGSYLLWLQTYGERFRSAERKDLKVESSIRWKRNPSRIPADTKDFSYDQRGQCLLVADGVLEGVRPEVWDFQVSGMKVVPKWLGYRTAKGTGKAVSSKSPLDHIRPTEWSDEWSHELRELIHVLTETIDLLPQGVLLLDQILEGPLISADELPKPPAELRKPPKVKVGNAQELELE